MSTEKNILGSLVLLAALSSGAFADELPSWLHLPSPNDPRPAGSSAWVLENSEVDTQLPDGSVTTHFRYAVMPLSAGGAKHSGWGYAFMSGSSSVTFSRAWAMSPDGRKFREFGGTDFVEFSPTVSNWIWDQTRAISFDPQRYLQVGWVFACEVEVKSDSSPFDIHWNPRGNLPVRHASLRLVPPDGGSVKWKAPAGFPAPTPGAGGALTWSLDNLPQYEADTPSTMSLVGTDLRAYMMGGPGESRTWADVVRLARREMDPKAVLTPAVSAIAGHEAGAGDTWARIAPVCRYVQKRITYLEVAIDSDSMAGYRPHAASEVCDNLYGDCKDKATLLCTMLRGLGVDACVMLVNSGVPTANVADWPSAYFNHAIVAIACREAPPAGATKVRAGGRDYMLFDPTDDTVPFGLLPGQDMGGLGLVLGPDVDAPVTIPPTPADEVTVAATVKEMVSKDGSAEIDVAEDRFGLSAAAAEHGDEVRTELQRQADLEQRIEKRLPLFADLRWKDDDEAPNGAWRMTAHFSAQSLAKRMRGGVYVPTDLMSVVPFAAPWVAVTEGWVSVKPGTLVRDVTVEGPPGWTLAEVPADWTYRSSAGSGSLHYEKAGNGVVGHFRLSIRGGVLDRKGYLDNSDLLIAALGAERVPLVFTMPPPPQRPPSGPAQAAH